MSYSHKVVVGVDVVELDEQIDLYTVPEVKKFCKSLLAKENKKVIISLEKVGFIDSSGLGMLLNLKHEASTGNVGFKLAALSPEVSKTFSMTKFHDNFEIFGTVNEAIRSFG